MRLKSTPESTAYNRALGSVLSSLRERASLTQEEVAEHVGRSKQSISNYELGTHNINLCPWEMIILAQLFRIQPEEFFLRARTILATQRNAA